MSDLRGILRGTFISDQCHYWKYRACFSPFHCCFGNSFNCFRSIFALQKEIPMSTFSGMPLEMWLLLRPFFSSISLTLRVGWVRTWSGSTLADLSVKQLEVQELIASPPLASVSTENKGKNLVVKWTIGQLSLVLL